MTTEEHQLRVQLRALKEFYEDQFAISQREIEAQKEREQKMIGREEKHRRDMLRLWRRNMELIALNEKQDNENARLISQMQDMVETIIRLRGTANMTAYLDDGIMDSTKELREQPYMQCHDKWQKCHTVGLNLIKQILNYYSRVYDWRLSDEEFATLKADINNVELNIRCCSPATNKKDVVVEKAVLAHIFNGQPLEGEAARQMFAATIALLHVTRTKMPNGTLAKMVDHFTEQSFPLQKG